MGGCTNEVGMHLGRPSRRSRLHRSGMTNGLTGMVMGMEIGRGGGRRCMLPFQYLFCNCVAFVVCVGVRCLVFKESRICGRLVQSGRIAREMQVLFVQWLN